MQRCELKWLDDKTLQISGTIDEHFSLEELAPRLTGDIWIDLSGVVRINSCGVREWIKVIAKSQARLHYRQCSSVIVSQFSMIPEFLGPFGRVESFEAQYVCPQCGHEDKLWLEVGKDILAGLSIYEESPPMECTACGSSMECDHNPELYFSFLCDAS